MVEFENFVTSAPPYAGVEWLLAAARAIGLPSWYKGSQHTPARDTEKFYVSCARDPFDWLKSIWFASKMTNILGTFDDELSFLIKSSTDFNIFIRRCAFRGDIVGSIFRKHNAASVLRVEDFPWALIEFFQSTGAVFERDTILDVQVFDGRLLPVDTLEPNDDELRATLLRSEAKFCEAYSYT